MGKAMTTTAQATLMHAAELLEDAAKLMRTRYRIFLGITDWKDDPAAREEHDDALTTALELRLIARGMKN